MVADTGEKEIRYWRHGERVAVRESNAEARAARGVKEDRMSKLTQDNNGSTCRRARRWWLVLRDPGAGAVCWARLGVVVRSKLPQCDHGDRARDGERPVRDRGP